MDNINNKYLYDIQLCISNIDRYIGPTKIYSEYESNDMLQDAVERNLEIIGEAINQLLKINPEIPITNARRIVDTRNKIIHDYDGIEPVHIWAIIINHLPLLQQEVQILLNND